MPSHRPAGGALPALLAVPTPHTLHRGLRRSPATIYHHPVLQPGSLAPQIEFQAPMAVALPPELMAPVKKDWEAWLWQFLEHSRLGARDDEDPKQWLRKIIWVRCWCWGNIFQAA